MGIGEGVTVVEHTLDCLGQLLSAGIEDGYMVQAGVALRRRRPTGLSLPIVCRDFGSEPPRTRTWNLEIKSLLLCQLS